MFLKITDTTFSFLLSIFLVPFACCFEYNENLISDPITASKWITAAEEYDRILFPQKPFIIEFLEKRVPDLPLSADCSNSLTLIVRGLREKKLWAYQFLDASARGKSGLAHGYISDLGSFDQCLDIEKDDRNFAGNYCLVNFKFPLIAPPTRNFLRILKLNLRSTEFRDSLYELYGNHTELLFYESFAFAVCIPSTCNRTDLEIVIKDAFDTKELKIEPRGSCSTYSDFKSNLFRKPLVTQFCFLLVITLTGLVWCGSFVNYFNLPGHELASNFCAIRNTRKLFADYTDPSMQKLGWIDCFKCIFQVGGTFGHIVCFMPVVPVMFAGIQDLNKSMDSIWLLSEFLQKAIYMTQVIFAISGFFAAYYMIPLFGRTDGERLSFLAYGFKRWIRAAPTTCVAIALLFCVSAIGYGPLVEDLEGTYLQTCRKSWILTVLQINNIFPTYDTCLPQTWTQSADFQLWLIAFFPLKWLATNPRKGINACFALIGLGFVIPMFVTYVMELPAPIGSTRPLEIMFLIVRGSAFPAMCFHTYNNISSYFMGVLLGYICYKEIKISFIHYYILTIFCWAYFLSCLYGPYIWQHMLGLEFNSIGNAVYSSAFKISFGLQYVVSFYGIYFFINRWPMTIEFAGNKMVRAFGRLSLSIYVTQLAPISYYMSMSYDPLPINKYALVLRVLSIVAQCCLTGYFTFLIVEAPFINLTKNMGFKDRKKKQLLVQEQDEPENLKDKRV